MVMPWSKQHRLHRLIIASIIALISRRKINAFTTVTVCYGGRRTPSNTSAAEQLLSLAATPTVECATNAIDDAKLLIENSIRNTDRGRSVKDQIELKKIHKYISNLESLCPLSEPARDERMGGAWEVLYTDAPPPSNGQLGLFKGVAMQFIDLKNKRYRNELYVGGDDADRSSSGVSGVNNGKNGAINVDDAWLSAVLDAEWAEWDGVYLDSPHQQKTVDDVDHGATTWKVTFSSITFRLFKIPIFTKIFDKNTSRTWKMTYLDDETRIVRAGRTGRGNDTCVFYMKRR